MCDREEISYMYISPWEQVYYELKRLLVVAGIHIPGCIRSIREWPFITGGGEGVLGQDYLVSDAEYHLNHSYYSHIYLFDHPHGVHVQKVYANPVCNTREMIYNGTIMPELTKTKRVCHLLGRTGPTA